ncbi:hypothetical protein HKD37_02G004400 [Glycine soja]
MIISEPLEQELWSIECYMQRLDVNEQNNEYEGLWWWRQVKRRHRHSWDINIVATYPSAGGRRVTRGMRVPRKEYARSRHQRLFEESVGKTGKDAIYELLSERFGSCIYARGSKIGEVVAAQLTQASSARPGEPGCFLQKQQPSGGIFWRAQVGLVLPLGNNREAMPLEATIITILLSALSELASVFQIQCHQPSNAKFGPKLVQTLEIMSGLSIAFRFNEFSNLWISGQFGLQKSMDMHKRNAIPTQTKT